MLHIWCVYASVIKHIFQNFATFTDLIKLLLNLIPTKQCYYYKQLKAEMCDLYSGCASGNAS